MSNFTGGSGELKHEKTKKMVVEWLIWVSLLALSSAGSNNAWNSTVHDYINNDIHRMLKQSQAASVAVDKVRGSKSFVLLFTSGTGSTWLWQHLSVTPSVCMLGYEPLGNKFQICFVFIAIKHLKLSFIY